MGNIFGILGLNSRNIDYIGKHNPRKYFPFVDNKLLTKIKLIEAGIPTPKLIFSAEWFYQLNGLDAAISNCNSMVIKPAKGMAGRGILMLQKNSEGLFESPSGNKFNISNLKKHCEDILYGVYSIDNTSDKVLIENRIYQHPFFDSIYHKGMADIRIIIFRGKPVMSMCRIPTEKSDGKANVSQGAIAAGVDIKNGKIFNAQSKYRVYSNHPDTGHPLIGSMVPHWEEIISLSSKIAKIFPLGYLGADIVLDKTQGPLVLEINARPGLEIQNANLKGLKEVLG